jgi:hypothetical protein
MDAFDLPATAHGPTGVASRGWRPHARGVARRGAFVSLVAVAALGGTQCATAAPQSSTPAGQARSEKESRTPAQRKINSQLLYELYRLRGEAKQKMVPPDPTGVKLDEKHRALVDVRAEVTPQLQEKIRTLGGTIQGTSAAYRSIIAWIPLLKLEQLAADPAVSAIEPKAEAAIR